MKATFELQSTHFIDRRWDEIEPYYRDLDSRQLSGGTVGNFLADWSLISERIDETNRRLEVATTRDTSDEVAAQLYHNFIDHVYPRAEEAEQRLKLKLLDSGLEPSGFAIPLRKLRAEVALYHEANVSLLGEEKKLIERYFAVTGGWTAEWEGESLPLSRLWPVLESVDRPARERAWRLMHQPILDDRPQIDDIWRELLALRGRIAANAGLDYRSYRWQQLKRFDYTPDDCRRFHQSVEEVVVPAAQRVREQRQNRLGLASLRPWDLHVDPDGRPPLQPFDDFDELNAGLSSLFGAVDPQLGQFFDTMVREDLLDLEPRKNKAPVGYCLPFNASRRPFIFLHLNKMHEDVVSMLHEGGHAFHVFEMSGLPYYLQRDLERIGPEFGEVGSIAMEMLALKYLSQDRGGFYDASDASRAELSYLQSDLTSWPYIALVDAFQHWVYENPEAAADPNQCDEQYLALTRRFLPGVDWTCLEHIQAASWRSIPHITEAPFYFIEYGLAQLGAVQIWGGAQRDHAQAVARYRQALQCGDTLPIPDLYRTAGATLSFDAGTMRAAVEAVEHRIGNLQTELEK